MRERSGYNPLDTIAAAVRAAVPTAKTVCVLARAYKMEEPLARPLDHDDIAGGEIAGMGRDGSICFPGPRALSRALANQARE